MRMRQLNLNDPEIYHDEPWLTARKNPVEDDGLDCGGDIVHEANDTQLDTINRSNLDHMDQSPLTLQKSIASEIAPPTPNRQKSTLRSKLSLTGRQEPAAKLPKTAKMSIRLDRSQLYVVLRGKVRVERCTPDDETVKNPSIHEAPCNQEEDDDKMMLNPMLD